MFDRSIDHKKAPITAGPCVSISSAGPINNLNVTSPDLLPRHEDVLSPQAHPGQPPAQRLWWPAACSRLFLSRMVPGPQGMRTVHRDLRQLRIR